MEYSINELAKKIVGKRKIGINTIIFDQPAELDYHCPVCKYENVVDGNFDERLHWSEYNGFIWCQTCDKDYPSVLCQLDIEKAIKTYLTCIQEASNLKVVENITDYHEATHKLNKKSMFPNYITIRPDDWFKEFENKSK